MLSQQSLCFDSFETLVHEVVDIASQHILEGEWYCIHLQTKQMERNLTSCTEEVEHGHVTADSAFNAPLKMNGKSFFGFFRTFPIKITLLNGILAF